MKRFFISPLLLGMFFSASACTLSPQLQGVVATHEKQQNIPNNLLLALISKESSFCSSARSPRGAIGLGQLLPGTASMLRVNPYDSADNIRGAAIYLKRQYQLFGNWSLALAAYNAGPGNVMKYKGIPPFAETRFYVTEVFRRLQNFTALAGKSLPTSAPVIMTKLPANTATKLAVVPALPQVMPAVSKTSPQVQTRLATNFQFMGAPIRVVPALADDMEPVTASSQQGQGDSQVVVPMASPVVSASNAVQPMSTVPTPKGVTKVVQTKNQAKPAQVRVVQAKAMTNKLPVTKLALTQPTQPVGNALSVSYPVAGVERALQPVSGAVSGVNSNVWSDVDDEIVDSAQAQPEDGSVIFMQPVTK